MRSLSASSLFCLAMQKSFIVCSVLLAFINLETSFAQDSTKTERALSVVPLITSSPLLGFGVGVSTSYLYYTKDRNSSKSQLQVGGQYSNTQSLSLFIKNNAWFRGNDILSNTTMNYSDINNEFTSEGQEVEYAIQTFLIKQLMMFRLSKSYYLGGEILYRDLKYSPNNTAGEDFLFENGIVDEKSGGLGVSGSYDTRKNKYFPSNAAWISTKINAYPSMLGALDNYYSLVLDGRYYARGFTKNDVWAWHLYGQYSSDKTPDAGLPSLSGKTLLRGFPAGQFKARYLTGGQTEYRYTIGSSRFRIIGFFGMANLSGGSFGVEDRSREDDGWYWAGGLGARFTVQPKTGVDLRLDLVTTSENVQSLYLKMNQAF